ncbi:ABC transporter ATP-binding protein [Paenibacillus polymyxa]|jgi:ABC-2 type transport system ATP-binding protein|uniref:ABC transporter ATP-binding protein n=1 Tax=Paenibacillus TaxID=44249 RepID=UPI000E3BA332|nr:ABC transporter ATP-binding protein [Paenibacillus jamilae]MEB4781590.1 ABC transporter ATP-binding protein [Paenibacillus jamilae]RFT95658.1 ABC transporter ATP-binding protein [Paenibacillus jamilae]
MTQENKSSFLQLDQVSFSYGSKEILHGINWGVSDNQITVLLGPNGAGKSTLLSLIAGLHQVQKGIIRLNQTIIDFENQNYKSMVGYLQEFPFYYPVLSVVEMMRLIGGLRQVPKDQLEKRIAKWLERFKLEDYQNIKMEELSQGTKKRVALASTLLHEPTILILDEPTNGLDPDQVMIVRSTLREYLTEGRVILLSTHIIGLAEKLADQVAILRNGRITYAGRSTIDLECLYIAHQHD